ncbi:MAG TPA: MerC domain-containing protein [Ferruginibacter sp.]|nr:MerC domain-containing protein [Ferruginibacter sp.]HMP19828.1 MerC domain-containing protein [Ferruginibacter sp.]
MEAKFNWDWIGIGTSILCAIHCALLPLIVPSLSLFGFNIIHNVFFEWGMILFAFIVGSYALFHGYIRHHRSLLPVYIFAAGFALLLLKQFFLHIENWLLLPAVCLIIAAHYYNYRLCHRTRCSSPHHKH